MTRHEIGEFSQRALVIELRALVDAASAKNSSAHKDIAKAKLRRILETENWRTTHVLGNISSRRCRFIAGMGHWVPSKFLLVTDWKIRPGVEKKDPEYE